MDLQVSKKELMQQAKKLESINTGGAAKLYHEVIRQDRYNADAYSRLMILYRKTKDFNQELKTIKKAIAAFRKLYSNKASSARKQTVSSLSRSLMRATGLTDKKGEPQYDIEPIRTWLKRMAVVKKKLG